MNPISLTQENALLKKEIELRNQELYDCKRQLKISEALQLEYQSEIELLQSEGKGECDKWEVRIAGLEEDNLRTRTLYQERLSVLEQEIEGKDEQLSELEAQIELLKKTRVSEVPPEVIHDLNEEIHDLKEENDGLLEIIEELKGNLSEAQNKCTNLEENLTCLKEEMQNLKETLQYKKEELVEANELVQKLNDEILCLKSEIESIKSKPLDQKSQGNSLFAEVNDRRVHLEKNISNMKKQYVEMKKDRYRLLNKIDMLHVQNKMLCERWDSDKDQREEYEQMVVNSLQTQISTLEDLVANYKKDLSLKLTCSQEFTYSEMEYFQKQIVNKTLEIENLRDQVTTKALSQTLLTESLRSMNNEMRMWKWKATKLQCELEILKNKLESAGVKSDIINWESKDLMDKIDKDMETDNKESFTVLQNHLEQLLEPPIANKGIIKEAVENKDVLKKNTENCNPKDLEKNEAHINEVKPETLKTDKESNDVIVIEEDSIILDEENTTNEEVKSETLVKNEEVVICVDDLQIPSNNDENKPMKIEQTPVEQEENKENVTQDKDILIEIKEVLTQNNDNLVPAKKETSENVLKPKLDQQSGISAKKVTFSEDTNDSKTTNRILLRKGGKLVKCPPPMIFK